MKTVAQLADEVLNREGGYVNDRDDPGGATNFGVTIHTMKRLGIDVDGNGVIDVTDVKKLTRSMAREIFIREYFERPGIGGLPVALQPSVFDMYINAGSNAIRILQRVLGLVDDGAIGPKTIAAAERCMKDDLVDAYGIARRDYYYGLADRRPASRKYARRKDGGKGGWITRAEEFISPEKHLTDAQHRARVAKWG